MVEFGCIDIATEVSLLFSHLAYPREGHLKTALHMMSYLSHKHNERLIIDPTYPKIDMGKFPQFNWTKFYGDVEEAIPVGMPEPLGKDVEVRMMCGSDHAEDKRTRCSCTGFLIFCNMALIDWVFKKQETIETSVFGAKFVAMKHRIKKLWGLWYKLAWWESHWPDPPLYMRTISHKWQTQPDLSQHWKRNATPSATMRCENQLQWLIDVIALYN